MNSSSPQNSDPLIDPDEAPEVTASDLKRGTWSINGKVVSETEGRAAFASRLKNNAEAENGTLPNNHTEKPISES